MEKISLLVRPGNVVSRGDASPYENYAAEAAYVIEGTDASGQVKQTRTYTEFMSFRDLLRYRWPGFILPYLSPPPMYPLAHASSSEEHRQVLEEFLQRLSDLPCLYKSAETQLFLRSPREFEVASEPFFCEIGRISVVYTETFTQFSGQVYDQQMFDEVSHYGGFLQEVETEFIQAKGLLTEVHQSHHTFEREYLLLLHLIEHPEGTDDITVVHEETTEYTIVSEWINTELKELHAVINSILRVVEIYEKRNKLLNKRQERETQLAKGKSSRISISEWFGASKQKLLAKMQEDIAKISERIQQHDHVMNVALRILHNEQLPAFKRHKKQRYQAMLAAFSDFALNYFRSLIEVLQFKFSPYLKS